ncbi:MAG: GntR family transcriptional regulator [Chthoniobacterales bacterium]
MPQISALNHNTISRKVQEAANKLENHIRACDFKSGDRYITTEEASKMLGISLMTTQRAMNLLSQNDILERRPKAGTFIGSGFKNEIQTTHVHFCIPENTQIHGNTRNTLWEQIDGMQSILGTLSAHFHFVPRQSLIYVQDIIQKSSPLGLLNAVVLILASREMRDYFNQSGIPTVVEGGVEPDLKNLCWIQWDQVQVGQLLAEHVISRGHHRIASIMRDIWSIGEHQLHDGINDTIAAAQLPSNTLRIRSAPNEEKAISELVRGLLKEKNPPTAFICRSEFQANCTASVVREAHLTEKIEIVHCNAPAKPEKNRYTCTVPELSMFDFGKVIGEMFKCMISGKILQHRGREIPVRIKLPAS